VGGGLDRYIVAPSDMSDVETSSGPALAARADREGVPGPLCAPAPEAAANLHRHRSGLGKLVHDLRYRRRRFRQLSGIVFVFAATALGRPEPWMLAVGAPIVVLAMVVRLWASGLVMKNEVLATIGPYARVRHPLYVGNILAGLGMCFASGLWWSFPAALALLLVFYPEAIRYEDQKLRRLFPGQWDRWAARTSALVPSLTPFPSEDPARQPRWSLRLSTLRNGEPIHILIGFLCLGWLYAHLP
jgi:hypothetical protein